MKQVILCALFIALTGALSSDVYTNSIGDIFNRLQGQNGSELLQAGRHHHHAVEGKTKNKKTGNDGKQAKNKDTFFSSIQTVLQSMTKEIEQEFNEKEMVGKKNDSDSSTVQPTLDDEVTTEEARPSTEKLAELEQCEMHNGTMGVCQPRVHCIMQEPAKRRFTVCKRVSGSGGDGGESGKPPQSLCCPKVAMPLEQLKQQFELWLAQSRLEMFAAGLPKNPDGRCGKAVVHHNEQRMANETEDEFLRRTKPTNVRIVMGGNARLGQYPWMAAIFFRGQFICGGAIISDRVIVTAAHCFSSGRNAQEYKVRYESVMIFNGTENQVLSFLVHEKYHPPAIYNDIALVFLAVPIVFNDFVQPVCLPGKRMYNELMIGQMAYVTGYGDMSFGGTPATVLQEVDVKIINNTYCDRNYRRLVESGKKFKHGIGKSLICAGYKNGGKDACQGDSGGPLVLTVHGANYLIGLVSFGYRCALPKFPGVYTAVAHYLKWIFANLQI